MNLHTARLNLMPLSSADMAIFHCTNTNLFVRKYLWDDEVIVQQLSEEILEEVERCFRDQSWGLWKIVSVSDNNYVGYAGLWKFFDENQPQLLYALLPEYTGRGYATEASQAIIDYAFSQLKYDYLIASTDTANSSSGQVCQHLGMVLQEERVINGKATSFYRIENKSER